MASSAAATCLRLRVSDASRDTFREQTDAHLGASRAGCPHWSSEPHRFFDEVVAICDSALDRELRDAVRGFLTGGGPSSASSLILSNCGVDPDLPPTSLAMEANRDAMEQGEGQGVDRQTAAQAAVRTAFRKPGQHSEAWLFALSVLSGGTLTHSNPMETARGPILSNIIPIPERAHYQVRN
jgi:type IV pilus biogenesis protein CpaD/CtpE